MSAPSAFGGGASTGLVHFVVPGCELSTGKTELDWMDGDVSFENPGWLANQAQLPMSYWNAYASRFTSQPCWYRIDAVNAQVDDLVERRPELIVSGDSAADAVRPWKMPVVAIVYGSVESSSMDELGFVRAESAASGSVLVRPVPDDSFVNDALDVGTMRIAALRRTRTKVLGWAVPAWL